ncbi:MAG TPA: hypothetical protein VN737_21730 [Bryobacteraceae bacterium]|nr:hypothetical protein [Bryobacteraceae bacterium]
MRWHSQIRGVRRALKVVCLNGLILLPAAFAQTNVLTYHNDNSRTGQNLTESRLTLQNVNSTSFGRLFTLSVDGKVDAQPLYVSGLVMANLGVRNVVFVATEHDSVYAFDADAGAKLWSVSMLGSGETTSDNRNCDQVVPEIGVTATPVIDLKAGPHGTIYVVAMSKDAAGSYHQRLHALDIATGAEQFGGPVEIQASLPGNGDEGANGTLVFDPGQHKERAALLLLNGIVYTSWSSHCDIQPYTGWTIGYDELTLQQTKVFNFAPNGSDAAVWSSGAGPAADSNGNIFFQLANGSFETNLNAQGFPSLGDYGNAFIKLASGNGPLQVLDYWTMFNTLSESNQDEDLGSGGVLLLPDVTDQTGAVRHLGVGAGKDANIYVFDRDNMGKFNPNDNSSLYQEISGVLSGGEFGMPAWFNGTLYFGAVGDSIRAFSVTNARLSSTSTSNTLNVFGYPGATPSISANGASNAIVWAAENSDPAVLHAYDAADLGRELYNSNQAPGGRDQFGPGNKFITPTIADGKVFVGTTNSVGVFGLLNGQGNTAGEPAFTATPNPIPVSRAGNLGATVLNWNAPSATSVEVRIGSPDGTLFAAGGTTGSVSTGAWVTDGMTFYLQDTSAGKALTSNNTVATVVAHLEVESAVLSANPNPIVVGLGQSFGSTLIQWQAPSASNVEIHLGGPAGKLFAAGGSNGSAMTGQWVADGMVFFLQDTSGGKPLTVANTLGTVIAHVQDSAFFAANPNPIVVSNGATAGSALVEWDAPAATTVQVRVGSPDGALFAVGPSSGSAPTSAWVTDGMTFYLQDTTGGKPLTAAGTLATFVAHVQNSPFFAASPDPMLALDGTGLSVTAIEWNAPAASNVEIRIGAPDGALFAAGNSLGVATTGEWVTNGMVFYLQDATGGKPLTSANTLATFTASVRPSQ